MIIAAYTASGKLTSIQLYSWGEEDTLVADLPEGALVKLFFAGELWKPLRESICLKS